MSYKPSDHCDIHIGVKLNWATGKCHVCAEKPQAMTTDKELDALVERLDNMIAHRPRVLALRDIEVLEQTSDALSALRQERDRLREALQKTMARLADYLDSDHFNNIEAIVLAAGVPYPTALAPQEPTT